MRDEFFTIGGLVARHWRPAYPLLPWALTSALLTVAALWGHWSTGAPVEWMVLGLAAYELMMGLLALDDRERTMLRAAMNDQRATDSRRRC